MTKSIKELRELCLAGRYEGKLPGLDRIFYRKVSTYFTKLSLILGISANQATLLSLFFLLIGGFFLIFTNIIALIISALFLILYNIFDCVDGEIARYTKTTSKIGKDLDFIVGTFLNPYLFACMAFGSYFMLHDIIIFAFGFLAVIINLLPELSNLDLLYRIPYLEGTLPDLSKNTSGEKSFIGRYIYRPVRDLKFFLCPGGLIYPVLILTALDIYLAPLSINIPIIGLFTINARYAFLIVYGVGKLSSFVLTNIRYMKKEQAHKLA